MKEDGILEMCRKNRERFNKTISVTIEISPAHLWYLKEIYVPKEPKNKMEEKYVERLAAMSESDLNKFLVECSINQYVREYVHKGIEEKFGPNYFEKI